MEQIKVMIADDHSLIREGLRQLLEFDGSIKVVGEASNGVDCLEKLSECNRKFYCWISICQKKMG